MGNILYIVAIVLIIAWAIGLIGYNAGALIHVLLIVAVFAIVGRLLHRKKIA